VDAAYLNQSANDKKDEKELDRSSSSEFIKAEKTLSKPPLRSSGTKNLDKDSKSVFTATTPGIDKTRSNQILKKQETTEEGTFRDYVTSPKSVGQVTSDSEGEA
jgi:hypothetical protein